MPRYDSPDLVTHSTDFVFFRGVRQGDSRMREFSVVFTTLDYILQLRQRGWSEGRSDRHAAAFEGWGDVMLFCVVRSW